MKRNANKALSSFLSVRKDFHQEKGHSSDLDQKRNGILLTNTNHKENGTESQNWWWSNSVKADIQSSDPRVHYPEECSGAKVVENCQYTSALMVKQLKLFFAHFFCNQLSIHGAVSDLCEEYKFCHVRTGRLVLVRQSDPLFVPKSSFIKTPIPSTDDPAQEDLLQKYQERVERLSQQNRVIKNCTDAGFLTTVGVGQYFMTKHTDEFLQFAEPYMR